MAVGGVVKEEPAPKLHSATERENQIKLRCLSGKERVCAEEWAGSGLEERKIADNCYDYGGLVSADAHCQDGEGKEGEAEKRAQSCVDADSLGWSR